MLYCLCPRVHASITSAARAYPLPRLLPCSVIKYMCLNRNGSVDPRPLVVAVQGAAGRYVVPAPNPAVV